MFGKKKKIEELERRISIQERISAYKDRTIESLREEIKRLKSEGLSPMEQIVSGLESHPTIIESMEIEYDDSMTWRKRVVSVNIKGRENV